MNAGRRTRRVLGMLGCVLALSVVAAGCRSRGLVGCTGSDCHPEVHVTVPGPRADGAAPLDAGCDGTLCGTPVREVDANVDEGANSGPDCKGDDCSMQPCADAGVCDGEEPYCEIARGRCVECLESSQCSMKEPYCVDGECEECRSDTDCSVNRRCRDGDCELTN